MPVSLHAWSTTLAFGLDLCLGDPDWLPHPVRAIGWLIRWLEARLYRGQARRTAGVLLLLTTVTVTGLATALLWRAGAGLSWQGRMIWEALLIWPALALRSLVEHSRAVWGPLLMGDLGTARARLALMVSRDTQTADATAVARGCIESVAENLVDGELAPLLFAFLGGPVAVWIYKAVSTLDSMVGYRNAHYGEFGWASARADDAFNFIPARLCFTVLPVSAVLLGRRARHCWRTMRRDGDKNPSPNSGIPEAGVAGALGLELGGVNVYEGRMLEKPRLNAGARFAEAADIPHAQNLVLVASAVLLLLLLALKELL